MKLETKDFCEWPKSRIKAMSRYTSITHQSDFHLFEFKLNSVTDFIISIIIFLLFPQSPQNYLRSDYRRIVHDRTAITFLTVQRFANFFYTKPGSRPETPYALRGARVGDGARLRLRGDLVVT